MDQRLLDVVERQRQFQKLCEMPFDSDHEEERNRCGEVYLFKAIEEIIELRKTFPSTLNRHSKTQNNDLVATKLELADVVLFLLNFCLAKGIDLDDLLNFIEVVQDENLQKLLGRLGNESIQKLKGGSF